MRGFNSNGTSFSFCGRLEERLWVSLTHLKVKEELMNETNNKANPQEEEETANLSNCFNWGRATDCLLTDDWVDVPLEIQSICVHSITLSLKLDLTRYIYPSFRDLSVT